MTNTPTRHSGESRNPEKGTQIPDQVRYDKTMLADYALLLISAVLVNNFVLVQFLGLCPFMGVSNKLETAIGMSSATTFVLTLASICSWLTYQPLTLQGVGRVFTANHHQLRSARCGAIKH